MRLSKLLVPAVAFVALLAGCTKTPEPTPTPTTNGVDALEVEEILDRATQALEDAGSFRLSGAAERDGEQVDVDIAVSGEQMRGSFTVLGLEVEFAVDEEGSTYLRGGALLGPLLGADLGDLGDITDKWIKTPPGGDGGLTPDVGDFLAADDYYTKGEVTEYKGQPAITLVDTDGEKLYVSLVGEPYPLAIEGPEGTLEFTDFGEEITIEIPSADDVVEMPSAS